MADPAAVAKALADAKALHAELDGIEAEFAEGIEPEEYLNGFAEAQAFFDTGVIDAEIDAEIEAGGVDLPDYAINATAEYRAERGAFFDFPKPNGQYNGHASEEKPPQGEVYVGPKPINFSDSLHIPIQPREWLDEHKLLRKGTAFQLNGDGGMGKTEIALQIMVGMTATGKMFKMPVEMGDCLFVSFEEPENEIRWRIDHLCHAFNIPSSSVKNLNILDLTGERDPWMFKERDRQLQQTDRWTWLQKEFDSLRPKFIVMDNKTRFFGGNQNDAVLATTYAHHLELACRDFSTTIMPLAHVSLNQMQSGRGDSGSVAAGNAFRSRLFFNHGDPERKPDDVDGGARKLTVMKANASPVGTNFPFQWHKGLEFFDCQFTPPVAGDDIGLPAKHKRVFLKLMDLHAKEKIDLSNDTLSRRYAPKLFDARQEREGCGWKGFVVAMQTLIQDGVIEVAEVGKGTRARMVLRRVKHQ
jgi:hypothetical protein